MTEFSKDPDAVLDYQVNWEDWLVTDTISSSAWTVQSGLTAGNGINGAPAPSNTTTTATIWLLSGTANKIYMVTNRITTAAGRTNDYSLKIFVTQL